MKQPQIIMFDPFPGSTNLGDAIITDACVKQLRKTSPNAFVSYVSLHQPLQKKQRMLLKNADLLIVAGSNMLTQRTRQVTTIEDLPNTY